MGDANFSLFGRPVGWNNGMNVKVGCKMQFMRVRFYGTKHNTWAKGWKGQAAKMKYIRLSLYVSNTCHTNKTFQGSEKTVLCVSCTLNHSEDSLQFYSFGHLAQGFLFISRLLSSLTLCLKLCWKRLMSHISMQQSGFGSNVYNKRWWWYCDWALNKVLIDIWSIFKLV